MWKLDPRLRRLSDLVNAEVSDKYDRAVNDHAYAQLATVLDWLAAKVASHFKFIPQAPELSAIAALLTDGDRHYAELFVRLDLLPRDRDPLQPVEPLSYAVEKIRGVMGGERLRADELPTAYGHLEEALLAELARLLAKDERYHGYARWQQLSDLFFNSHHFYRVLVKEIPEATIQKHAAELAAPYDADDVVRYISQADKRMEADAYQRDYLQKIEKYRDASPAKYIDKLTSGADTMSLPDDQLLKKDLTAHLGRSAEISWIDGLRWPLAQAAALNEYQDLEELQALVTELVGSKAQLQTPFVHLLLVILDQYINLMRRITFELASFGGEPGHYYYEPERSKRLFNEGKLRLNTWKDTDIADSIDKLLAPLQSMSPIDDELHRGLFGWVAAQDRELWLNNPNYGVILQVIDQLQDRYLQIYTTAHWSKADLLRAISPDPINWKTFKLIYAIWQSDESDHQLGIALREQMTAYIQSRDFSWNSGYHFDNHHIYQALHFVKLCLLSPDPGTMISTLAAQHRNWHEGWACSGAGGHEGSNRYIFLLTCGVCLALHQFDAGDQMAANNTWCAYTRETTIQYRACTWESHRLHYLLPLRLVIHTVLKHQESLTEDCMRRLFTQIDHLEDRIVLAESLMTTAKFLGKTVDSVLRQELWQLIENRYWVMTLRIKQAKHLGKLTELEKLYEQSKLWYTSP